MKTINQFIKQSTLPMLLLGLVVTSSFVANKSNVNTNLSATEQKIMFVLSNMSAEDIKALSPSSYEKLTGHKLSWSETIALKKVKKNMSASHAEDASGQKSQGTAFLLCWFLGLMGVHRFYLGRTGSAVAQIFTLGGCGIWTFIDWIRIIKNTLPDANGNSLTRWFD